MEKENSVIKKIIYSILAGGLTISIIIVITIHNHNYDYDYDYDYEYVYQGYTEDSFDSNATEQKYIYVPEDSGRIILEPEYTSNPIDLHVADSNGETIEEIIEEDNLLIVEVEEGKKYTITAKSVEETDCNEEFVFSIKPDERIDLSGLSEYEDELEREGCIVYCKYIPSVSGAYYFETDREEVQIKLYEVSEDGKVDVTLIDNVADLEKDKTYLMDLSYSEEEENKGSVAFTLYIKAPAEIRSFVESNSYEGTLSYPNQQDVYTYVPEQEGVYAIDTENEDIKIEIYDEKEEYVTSSLGIITYKLLEDTQYDIVVSTSSNEEINYTITLQVPHTVRSFMENEFYESTLSYPDQQDVYTYIPEQEDIYAFDTDNEDIKIEIYNEEDQYIASDFKKVMPKLLADTQYNVVVSASSDEEIDYTITLYEPPSESYIDQQYTDGMIVYPGLSARYLLTPKYEGIYTFTMEGCTDESPLDIIIYGDKDKNEIISSGRNKIENLKLERHVTYYVVIEDREGIAPIEYTLVVDGREE